MRNPVFAPQVMGTWKQSRVTITPIESVTSTDSGDGLLCLLGMLTQPESGKFCLEDLRDKVSLDISSAVTMPGLFTETCVVLVQGKYRSADDVFEVQMMGFPPAERRLDSLLAMGRVDTLGAFNTPDELKKVYEMQEKAVDSQVVILSDVHLDDAAVVEDLKKLFDG